MLHGILHTEPYTLLCAAATAAVGVATAVNSVVKDLQTATTAHADKKIRRTSRLLLQHARAVRECEFHRRKSGDKFCELII